MTEIGSVELEKIIVHKIGNPSKGQELKLSVNPLTLNDDLVKQLLTKYFLGGCNENELFRFAHLSDISMNEVYSFVRKIFEDKDTFIQQSVLLAQYLYSKSTHVKIKVGELYVVLFNNIPFEQNYISAVGIFKSETKETFLKVFPHGQSWEVISEEGVNINKLDKGCLVFNTATNDGYKVCVVDNTNKQNDAQYWVNEFLQVEPYADSYHHTDKYLSLCKSFVTNEYTKKFEVSKSDQINLLNNSIEYFKTKEQFNLQEFAEEVIHHPEVVDSFMNYKKNFESDRNFTIEDEFDIHLSAVKKQQRVFKTVLKLDRNFHIYIHGRRDLIERGVDEMTGKKFYKIYYEEET